MKKNVLGAIIFFSLLALAGLSLYIYAVRTGSGFRLQEFQRTAGFIEERITALEKQRDLLGNTVTALSEQSDALRRQSEEIARRMTQIDAEITNMKDLISGVRKTVKSPIFSPRGFRLTATSGIIIIAFLAFIWFLYATLRARDEEEEGDFLPLQAEPEEEAPAEPVPGSVLEDEFPPTAEGKPEPDEDNREEASAEPPAPAAEASHDADEGHSSPPGTQESGPTPADEAPPVEEKQS